jgi:hypothetical protein
MTSVNTNSSRRAPEVKSNESFELTGEREFNKITTVNQLVKSQEFQHLLLRLKAFKNVSGIRLRETKSFSDLFKGHKYWTNVRNGLQTETGKVVNHLIYNLLLTPVGGKRNRKIVKAMKRIVNKWLAIMWSDIVSQMVKSGEIPEEYKDYTVGLRTYIVCNLNSIRMRCSALATEASLDVKYTEGYINGLESILSLSEIKQEPSRVVQLACCQHKIYSIENNNKSTRAQIVSLRPYKVLKNNIEQSLASSVGIH